MIKVSFEANTSETCDNPKDAKLNTLFSQIPFLTNDMKVE